MEIYLEIENLNDSNRKKKFQKAIKKISEVLQVPATIEHKDHEKEDFPFKAQEELYEAYKERFGMLMDDLYSRVCSTLGIRPVSTFRKAIDPNAPKLGKEIFWNPETGQPITQKEMDRLLDAIDKFMNRNVGPMQKEFTISQAAVGRILGKLRENNTLDALRDRPLDELKAKGHKWDSIDTYGQLNELFPGNYERLKFRERVVGNYIQDINDSTRKRIRDTLDQGFLSGKTKSEISQELFYNFGSLNKDWDRIVDTEGVNIFNAEFMDEQIKETRPGEPLYFIRREFSDKKTCSFCIKATQEPIIARWSDVPLQDESIKDPVASIAVWDSKTNYGRSRADWWWAAAGIHPNCFPVDTEVLTDNGWKFFKDVLLKDKIMSINPETKEVDFVNHKGLMSYHYKGDMIRFHGRNYDLMATPDHNQLYLSTRRNDLKSKTMEELYGMSKVIFPRAVGIWKKPEKKIMVKEGLYIDDIKYARLWAWYLSDGSGKKKGNYFQIPQKDNTNIKADLGSIITNSGCVASPYNKLLLEMKGRLCNEKYIPVNVKELRKEALLAFLDSYSKADGMKRTGNENHEKSYKTKTNKRGFDISFFTTSDQLASDIGEIIIKAGYIPSYHIQNPTGELLDFPNGRYKAKLKLHIIRMCKSRYRYFLKHSKSPGNRSKVPYDDMVYDVELEKWHFLLVKRNGKLAWSGNCRGTWDKFYEEIGEIVL